MPQPLSSLRRHVSVFLNNAGVYPLREREMLARYAMEGIATWATVESFMLRLYLELAGGNQTIAAAMFLKLESNSAKVSVLGPLIDQLTPDKKALYAAIAKLIKARGKARDKLAHWVWGYSPQ